MLNNNFESLEVPNYKATLEFYIKYSLFLVMLAVVFFWGAELFNLSITIDEELHAFQAKPNAEWLAQGRWGTYFLNKYLLPYTIIPLTPLIIFLLCYSLAYVILMGVASFCGLENKIIYTIGFLIFSSHPAVYYIASFNTINYAIGVGFLCSALGWKLVNLKSNLALFFSVVLIAFSLGVYQGFIMVHIALILFSALIKGDDPGAARFLIKGFLVLVGGLLLYFLVNYIIVSAFKNDSSYINIYISKDSIYDFFGNPLSASLDVLEGMSNFYFGTHKMYGGQWFASLSLTSMIIFSAIYGVVYSFRRSVNEGLCKVFLFLSLALTPFLLFFIANGHSMPIRSLISFSLVLSFLYIITTYKMPQKFKLFAIAIGVFYLIVNSSVLNRTHQANHFARQFDKTTLVSVMPVVYEKIRDENLTPPFKLFFHGSLSNRGYTEFDKLEVNGQSYFEFGGGNPFRIYSYMKMLGYTQFKAVDKNEKDKIVEQLDGMSKWPVSGSVKVVDQVIVVQL